MKSEHRTTRVICLVPNGVALQVSEARRGEFGEPRFSPIGPPVELRPGENLVDEDFVYRWVEQNINSDLLQNNLVQFPNLNTKGMRHHG